MFCTNCGSKTTENSKFCSSCGTAKAQPVAQYNVPYYVPDVATSKPAKNRQVIIVCSVLAVAMLIGGILLLRSPSDSIVGTWELVEVTGPYYYLFTDYFLGMVDTFYRNGTGVSNFNNEVDEFVWTINGNRITIEWLTFDSSTTMIFEVTGRYMRQHAPDYPELVWIFRRINTSMINAMPNPAVEVALATPASGAATPTPAPAAAETPTPTPAPIPATPTPTPPVDATPTPTPAAQNIPQQIAIGDTISFGPYMWRVLDVQGDRTLIITDRVIYHRNYHHTSDAVTWETSEIRQWLNGEFFAGFNPSDQARIAQTYVVNYNNPWDFSNFEFAFGARFTGWGSTPGGNNTWDRIFLLSIDEVLQHFGDSGLVAIGATMRYSARDASAYHGLFSTFIDDQYNNARVANDLNGLGSSWWLRSPGVNPYFAASVFENGWLSKMGDIAAFWGEYFLGIRPALWLYIDVDN